MRHRRLEHALERQAHVTNIANALMRGPSPDSGADTSRAPAGGPAAGRSTQGHVQITRARTSRDVLAGKRLDFPVSISKSTAPNAQMSARLSTVFPTSLLRTHIGGGPEIIPACVIAGVVIVGDIDTLGWTGTCRGLHRFGEAEVEHLHGAVRTDFDVRSLQIPVDDPRSRARLRARRRSVWQSAALHRLEWRRAAMRWERSSPSTSSVTSAR